MDCIDDYRKIAGPDSCQVKPHSKPWVANLERKTIFGYGPFKHSCGGVLIGTRIVLTAAHCIRQELENNRFTTGPEYTKWKDLKVILGDHDLGDNSTAKKGQLGSRISLKQQEIEIEYGEAFPKWNGKCTDIIRNLYNLKIC